MELNKETNQLTRGSSCLDNICVQGTVEDYKSRLIHNGLSDLSAQNMNISSSKSANEAAEVSFSNIRSVANIVHFKQLFSTKNWDELIHGEIAEKSMMHLRVL